MVAGEESLVDENEKHSGPVRGRSRCPPSLHTDAQNSESPTARYALPRLQGRLLCENVQRRDQFMQGIR